MIIRQAHAKGSTLYGYEDGPRGIATQAKVEENYAENISL